MQTRVNPKSVPAAAYGAMANVQKYVNECGLEPSLLELVKIRASQINGCAFCLAMHTNDARKQGESDDRMHLLNAWREAPIYTAREQAALAWTEAVTLVAESHVPDEVYQQVHAQFSEKEIIDLTFAVITINSWNRLQIAFRVPPNVPAAMLRE